MPQSRSPKKSAATKRSPATNKASAKVTNWRSNKILIVALLFVVGFGGIGIWQLRKSDAATTSTNIATYDKAAVNSAYKSLWEANVNVASGWTGSVTGCKAGNISAAARAAQINAVNFARRMANLTPIVGANLTDTTQANVQKAALMMEANGKLSHEPPTSWKCYTNAGAATAGKSDLALTPGSTIKPVQAIKLYMDDGGSNNYAVGHRRWLLNPQTAVMAFGMTKSASAVQVIGLRQSTTSNNPMWAPWPSNGYFPNTIEPNGRWSISSRDSTCFANATVSVKRNGVTIPTTVLSRNITNMGNPTLVWQMPAKIDISGGYAYVVSINNANIRTSTGKCSTASSTRISHAYTVAFFKPY